MGFTRIWFSSKDEIKEVWTNLEGLTGTVQEIVGLMETDPNGIQQRTKSFKTRSSTVMFRNLGGIGGGVVE